MITVLENLLPQNLADKIEKEVSDIDVRWMYCDTTVDPGALEQFSDLKGLNDTPQLVVPVFFNGEMYEEKLFHILAPVVKTVFERLGIEEGNVGKVKLNSIGQKNDFTADQFNGVHTDVSDPNVFSIIYYINESDGDTVIFDTIDASEVKDAEITRISPKKNSCVVFNSNLWHASSNPIQNKRRLVANLMFALPSSN